MIRVLRWLTLRRSNPSQSTTLSLRGAVFLFGTTLIGLASFDAGVNLLVMVFGLCVGACILSGFSGWHSLRRLAIKRVAPDAVSAGQPFEIRYTITNTSRWGVARNIHVLDPADPANTLAGPEGFVASLRPGEQVILPVPSAARLRGRVRFSMLRLSTSFPFGIFGKSVFHSQEHELIVYPTVGRIIGEIKPASRAADVAQTGGAPASLKGHEEYYGVREFRHGDNPRRIHWRRSAQTGQLMVREMAKTRDCKFWCVVNTRVNPRDVADAQRLEAAISAAAAAICDALEKGVQVGLVCNGEPPLVLPPGGGRAHRPRLLRELALRARNVDEAMAPHVQRFAWPNRWRGACLLFAAHDSDDLREAARALTHSVGPTTLLVPGRPAFENLFFISQHAPIMTRRSSAGVN